jgi:hypothetical protein
VAEVGAAIVPVLRDTVEALKTALNGEKAR